MREFYTLTLNYILRMIEWGEHASGVAEGASNGGYESLRQKDPFMTRLWRVPAISATKEESRKVKLSGTWTEVL